MRNLLCFVLIVAVCFLAIHCQAEDGVVRKTVIPPTCTEKGYILYEDIENGITTVQDEIPALGHDFGEWKKDYRTSGFYRVCKECGEEEYRASEVFSSFPIIRLNGSMEGISKSDRIVLSLSFDSEETEFSCYAETTLQGHQTLNYPKKNYTIRLFDNAELTKKHKLSFDDWQYEHKYVLKANYRDVSDVRNLVAADLWSDMAKTRKNLYAQLCDTSNYGAVAGFPVAVYLNDDFYGLYSMNLHIDDDLYCMNHLYDAVMIANSSAPDETRFHALASFADEKNSWEVEFCGTGDDNQWAKDKLNEFIEFVMCSNDVMFKERLGDYLDIDGAVDYLIFLYVIGLENNAAKDLVLLKYQNCDVWIPSVYDMERAFGLAKDGNTYIDPDQFLPKKQGDNWDSCTGSLLWDRLLQNFEDIIKMRYRKLRTEILKPTALAERVMTAISVIPQQYYDMDLKLYPRNPIGNPEEQMVGYIYDRLPLLDQALLGNQIIDY